MIRALLFDLDNTLYPAHSPINANITARMNAFTARFLGISETQAVALRAAGTQKYGATIKWLQEEHGLSDIEEFYAFVHPARETRELIPDADLRPFLRSLATPMAVLTNAPIEHASRVLDFFNIADLFTVVFDIRRCGFEGKPRASAFNAVLKAARFNVADTLFLDDSPAYVRGYAALGGPAVLIDEFDARADEPFLRIRSVYKTPDILRAFNE